MMLSAINRGGEVWDSVAKSALDKDLKKVVSIETATYTLSRSLATPGLLAVFMLGAFMVAELSIRSGPLSYFVIVAAVIAAYMALNIGANDVANNMGPAVGSRALTMAGALAIAAVCEAAGAILAGGDVVNTVSRDLLRPADDDGHGRLHPGHDGGAAGGRDVDPSRHHSARAGFDHTCGHRRGRRAPASWRPVSMPWRGR